ncbi:MAG: thiosulfate oxidation carrier protein SoxY [Pseudomonadota bacterium]|nr:MAG: thiosulfate oxidation carrier protein SoxY [Pseudomonadota bacterium]
MQRRTFLKGTLAGGTVAVAVGAGLLSPQAVLAAWPKAAFESKSVQDALTNLMGSAKTDASGDIKIKAPDIAENGAVVPVSVTTSIAGVESIAILAEKNGSPLAANFQLGKGTKGFISTRIKMGKTSDVIAVVKAGGKAHAARKNVKVTIGGCGG